MEEGKELMVSDQAGALIASDSLFFNVKLFEHAQRVAQMLSSSSMVPEHFRGDKNIGNIMIAMNYANRINADIFMVMQSMYIVYGRPGIEAKLIIGLINQCGRFEPLRFEEGDDWCVAVTKDLKSRLELRGPKVTWDMVQKEGWDRDKPRKDGKGTIRSKWNSMRQLMFRYRAAAFFGRTYCPEVLLGMPTREELEEMTVTLEQTEPDHYEWTHPEPDDTAEETSARFNELCLEHFPDEARKAVFLGWLHANAAKEQVSVHYIMAEAVKQWDDAVEAFLRFERLQNADPDKTNTTGEPPAATGKSRLEQINSCRTPGLKKLIAQGVKAKWEDWSIEEYSALNLRAAQICPDDNFIDLVKEANDGVFLPHPESPEAKAQTAPDFEQKPAGSAEEPPPAAPPGEELSPGSFNYTDHYMDLMYRRLLGEGITEENVDLWIASGGYEAFAPSVEDLAMQVFSDPATLPQVVAAFREWAKK